MSMNIKSEAAHRMAAELAKLRGVSMTKVVTDALERELAEEKRRKTKEGRKEALLAIGRECRKHLPPGFSLQAAMDELYDEHGLPR